VPLYSAGIVFHQYKETKRTMKTELLLISDKRFRWIANIYFHLSASPTYQLNDFKNIMDFLHAHVGDLNWGKDDHSARTSKEKFGKAFLTVLSLYDFSISKEEISKAFFDDALKNYELIERLSSAGYFPKIEDEQYANSI
jgi:hypothetical protein